VVGVKKMERDTFRPELPIYVQNYLWVNWMGEEGTLNSREDLLNLLLLAEWLHEFVQL